MLSTIVFYYTDGTVGTYTHNGSIPNNKTAYLKVITDHIGSAFNKAEIQNSKGYVLFSYEPNKNDA